MPSEIITTMAQVPTTTPMIVSAVRPLRRRRLSVLSFSRSDIFIVVLRQLRGLLFCLFLFDDDQRRSARAQNAQND